MRWRAAYFMGIAASAWALVSLLNEKHTQKVRKTAARTVKLLTRTFVKMTQASLFAQIKP